MPIPTPSTVQAMTSPAMPWATARIINPAVMTRFEAARTARPPCASMSEEFVVSITVLKRYPCPATAHAAVKAVLDLQAEHGFSGAEVEAITVTGTRRMVEVHNILEPADLMLAQYSIPFSIALALHREARNPESWDETALADPQIRALRRRVRLVPEPSGEHAGMSRRPPFRGPRRERHARTQQAGGQIPAPDPAEPSANPVRRRSVSGCSGSRTRRTSGGSALSHSAGCSPAHRTGRDGTGKR
jgi:hypothetical protein